MDHKQLMEVCTSMGFYLLENGGEIYRVEETIRRICRAYGMERAEVFVIPSSIVVTLDYGEGDFITKTRSILHRDTNLDKVDRLNDLSRRICAQKPDYLWVRERMAEIMARPSYPFGCRVAATAAVSLFCALFFGGNLRDGVFALFVGAAIALLGKWFAAMDANSFFITMFSSALVAVLAVGGAALGLADHTDKVIIGTLMNLVPGIAITGSMQDIIAGDIITGMMRMTEAFLTAVGIAVGVTVPLAVLQNFLG